MEKLERKMIAPASERELIEANLGDIVKISYPGDRDNMVNLWTVLYGRRDGQYAFISQDRSNSFGENPPIKVHHSHISKMQFDNKSGATLNHLYYNVDFLDSKRPTYEELVSDLKEAKLWIDDKYYALYDENERNMFGFVTGDMVTAIGGIQGRNFKTKLIPFEQARAMREIFGNK